jgi:hypothetical protein
LLKKNEVGLKEKKKGGGACARGWRGRLGRGGLCWVELGHSAWPHLFFFFFFLY